MVNSKDDLSSRRPRPGMKRSKSIAGITKSSRGTNKGYQGGFKPYSTQRGQARGGSLIMQSDRYTNSQDGVPPCESRENISPEQDTLKISQIHEGEVSKDTDTRVVDATSAEKISQVVHPFSPAPTYLTNSQPNIPGSLAAYRSPAVMDNTFNCNVNIFPRSPLTPCTPGQIPQVRMNSPETSFQTSQKPDFAETGRSGVSGDQNPAIAEMTWSDSSSTQSTGSEQKQENDRAQESVADSPQTAVNDEVLDHNQIEDNNDKVEEICTPSFGDEFLDMLNSVTQNTDAAESACTMVTEDTDTEENDCTIFSTENLEQENLFLGSNYAPGRTAIIIIRRENYTSDGEDVEESDDEESNVNQDDDDGGFADALDRSLNAHIRRQLLCREVESDSNDNVDHLFADSAMEESDEPIPSTPSTYRGLLRSPSHFRCVICDTNLEVTPHYERSIFGFATGDLPSSHMEDGQTESDLYCPECGWRRCGYYSNKILDM